MTRQAHLAPDTRDRHAFAGGLEAQPVDAAGLDRLRAAAQQPLIDDPADSGADGAADDRAAQAQNSAAKSRPQRGTDSG